MNSKPHLMSELWLILISLAAGLVIVWLLQQTGFSVGAHTLLVTDSTTKQTASTEFMVIASPVPRRPFLWRSTERNR